MRSQQLPRPLLRLRCRARGLLGLLALLLMGARPAPGDASSAGEIPPLLDQAKPLIAAPSAVKSLPSSQHNELADAAIAPPASTPPPVNSTSTSATIEIDGKQYPAEIPVHPQRTPQGLAGVGLTAEQVNAAIDKGAAALWAHLQKQLAGGEALGDQREDVLECLALVHAGAAKKFPQFDSVLRQFLASGAPKQLSSTYQNALYCMLIQAYGDPAFFPQLQSAAQLLLSSQGTDGTYTYTVDLPDAFAQRASFTGPVLTISGSHAPGQAASETALARTDTDAAKKSGGDNSVTQFALLGLYSAERAGLGVPADAWKRILDTTRVRQDKNDGGWGYHQGRSYGSMTCAGICAIALNRFELGERNLDDDVAIRRGLGWLNANFSVERNPRENDYHFYYLYSLERVGRILDTEFINDKEWYPLGARYLVEHQQQDGNWVTQGEEANAAPALPDSFALLFLTRATPPLVRHAVTGPGQLRTATITPPGKRIYIILDCSGSMMDAMGDRQKFDIARDAVRDMLNDLPDNSEVALRAYGYSLRATQPGCDQDTKLLSPMAKMDRAAIGKILDGLHARGKTPLALSLQQAVGDLGGQSIDEKHPLMVLLLTDGGEDTWPRQNPVKAAAKLSQIPGIQFQIVGFDINQEDWDQQLRAMAAAAHGGYQPAAQPAALDHEIRAVAAAGPDTFTVLDSSGKAVFSGKMGQACSLPPGQYQFVADFAGKQYVEPFWSNAGETTSITFDAKAVKN